MSLSVDQFVASHNGKVINNGGTQCVAVANQYEAEVVGGGWIGTPLTGYAKDWWNNFNGSGTEVDNYVRVTADQPAQKGDLAVWLNYPTSGLPHIALVLADNGGSLNCFTQNPGTAHVENLVKGGLLGYLRPKKFVQVVTVAAQAPASGIVPWNGVVTLKTVVNVRDGASTQSGIVKTNPAGGAVSIIGYVHGEGVTQNGATTDIWLRTWNGLYIWSGNTNFQG